MRGEYVYGRNERKRRGEKVQFMRGECGRLGGEEGKRNIRGREKIHNEKREPVERGII